MLTKNYINENYEESFQYQRYNTIYKKPKFNKKKGNKCYCLEILENLGPINIIKIPNSPRIYVNKMELVKFNDHFDDLLEKGKILTKSQVKDDNKKSIPNITFWHQRYYYYSKYDLGIMMDNESNSIDIYNF